MKVNIPEQMKVPLPKAKMMVEVTSITVMEDGNLETEVLYDTKWAMTNGVTFEMIQTELGEILVEAMTRHLDETDGGDGIE